MTIIAQSADGINHEFPDGTNPAVIDKVMKDYVTSNAAPQSDKSVGGFLANIPKDAYDTTAGAMSAVRDYVANTDAGQVVPDIYRAGDKAGAIISGGLGNLYNAAAPQSMQMTPGPDMKLASQVGGALKDRYWNNLGNTVYNHPVQSALDASSLLYGGEGLLGRALGEGALATKAVGKTAGLLNPLNAVAKPLGSMRGSFAKSKALKEMRAGAPNYEQNRAATDAAYTELRSRGIAIPADEYAAINNNVSQIGQINAADAPRSHALSLRMKEAQMADERQLTQGQTAAQARLEKANANLRAAKATGRNDLFDFENEAQLAAHDVRQSLAATNSGKPVFFDQLDEFRKQAGAIANDTSPAISQTERAAASQITKQIDDVLNSTAGSPEIRKARELARRNILARDAIGMEKKSKFYTSGDESGIRNQFSSYGKREGDSLTVPEQAALLKVIRREGVHGLLNSAGSKLTQTMLLGGLGATGNVLPAMLGAGLSTGSRALSAAMTNAKAKQFLQTVLAGKEAQAAAMARAKRLPFRTKGLLFGAEGSSLLGGRQ